MRYLDILIERKRIRDSYLNNLEIYLEKIKEFFKNRFKNCRILLFGSSIRGEVGPTSDVDILVIIPEFSPPQIKRKLIYEVRKEIGFLSPFEFHIATGEEFKNWWQKFLKQDYKEI